MSNFAILRVQKLKSGGAVYHSLKHNFREQDTPNADPKLTPNNTHHQATNVADAIETFNKKLPEKIRKNAVYCIEYLITASPEKINSMSRNEQDEYFNNALAWLKEKHGADNVFCSSIHRDETTPHLCAYVIPLDEKNKLNCRKYLGERNALRDMQTEFHQSVASKYDLDRGMEGSRATHQAVKSFYGRIEQANEQYQRQSHDVWISAEDLAPKTLKKGFFSSIIEDDAQIAQRLTDQLNEPYRPILARSTLTDYAAQKKNDAEQRLGSLQRQTQPYLEARQGLDYAHRKQLDIAVKRAGEILKERQRQQEEQEQERKRSKSKAKDRGGFKL